MELVLASRNKGKIAEYRALVAHTDHTLMGLDEAGVHPAFEPPECARTFEGNALIKALIYGERASRAVLAEDSGLCIEALGGRPGVLSARYCDGTDEDRVVRVLEEMRDVPAEKRAAYFTATLVWYDPTSADIEITEGEWRGTIAQEARGKHGFGYDPIFIDAVSGKTGGELTQDEKNRVSHRAQAVERMISLLKSRG